MNHESMWAIHRFIFDDIGFFNLFAGILILNIVFLVVRYTWVMSIPDFNEYKRKYPGITNNGVKCIHCGSRNFFIQFFIHPGTNIGPKRFICRGCGEILFRN